MQRIRITITYLMLGTKFGLNGARMVKFGFGKFFIFFKSWKMVVLCYW